MLSWIQNSAGPTDKFHYLIFRNLNYFGYEHWTRHPRILIDWKWNILLAWIRIHFLKILLIFYLWEIHILREKPIWKLHREQYKFSYCPLRSKIYEKYAEDNMSFHIVLCTTYSYICKGLQIYQINQLDENCCRI